MQVVGTSLEELGVPHEFVVGVVVVVVGGIEVWVESSVVVWLAYAVGLAVGDLVEVESSQGIGYLEVGPQVKIPRLILA